ncbi:MAG TPA: electron transfer flavoprotein subunit alpha/FixB family protein [Candidatus Limnocylindrales bacterium]|nr:electron transfer flavoprotein subunit alpha/FixB family protein [Candidatus Limnocylindrales bacterium]
MIVVLNAPGGAIDRPSLEALTVARGLAETHGASLEAVLVGADPAGARAAAAQLRSPGVATALVVDHPELTVDQPDGWAAALTGIIASRAPLAVVGSGTERGNELFARVAARAGLPMAANCLAVEPSGDRYRLTRQRWAGSLLEDAWLDAQIKLLTIAPNSVPAADPVALGAAAAPVEPVAPDISADDLRLRVTSREAPERGKVSLGDAKVVVGGGRGVGSGEGFADLEELAALLGGAVGGSRVVTSAGWRPHSDQIGQTGLRIAPDVYIACGISGAIQHIVGCKAAKHILAINTDADAPIMGVADYAVIGDLHTVVPAISAELRRRGAAG